MCDSLHPGTSTHLELWGGEIQPGQSQTTTRTHRHAEKEVGLLCEWLQQCPWSNQLDHLTMKKLAIGTIRPVGSDENGLYCAIVALNH